MPKLFFISAIALLFTLCFRPSFENNDKKVCSNYYGDPICRRYSKICCNGACNSTCIGKRCRWDFQCGSEFQGHKCCAGHCRASCEGFTCESKSDCKDTSLQCCNKVCRKGSCLGYPCNSAFPSYSTCGSNRGARLDCCGGKCELSCRNRPCSDNSDCGGWSRRRSRMKCCNGVCKQSCIGSPCYEHRDCQSSQLDCCGFFDNKTCARSCLNHKCSLSFGDECGRRRGLKLFCCGDGICHRNCYGSKCYAETFRYDCRAPGRLLYCCGIGEKKCRISCSGVKCENNEDCGKSKYYCGPANRHNISTCKFTRASDLIFLHDVNLEDYTK